MNNWQIVCFLFVLAGAGFGAVISALFGEENDNGTKNRTGRNKSDKTV